MAATTHFKMFLTDARPEQLAAVLNRTDYTQDDKAIIEFDLVGTVLVPDVPNGSAAPQPDEAADPLSDMAEASDPALVADAIASVVEESDVAQILA